MLFDSRADGAVRQTDTDFVQMAQTYAEKERHGHVPTAAGHADLSAHAHAQRLGGNLAQRFPGGPGHASFLVFLRDQALALGGDHRPLNDAHHAGEKIAAEIRSRRTNLGFLQFFSALLFFLAALGHGDHDRGPRHFPAPGGKIPIHETSLLFWTHGGGKGRLTAAARIRSAYYTMPWPVCKGSAPPGLHFWRFCGFIRKEKNEKRMENERSADAWNERAI